MSGLAWSAGELADELGLSESSVRRHVDQIPHLKIGGRLVFPKAAVVAWLETAPLEAIADAAPLGDLVALPDHISACRVRQTLPK